MAWTETITLKSKSETLAELLLRQIYRKYKLKPILSKFASWRPCLDRLLLNLPRSIVNDGCRLPSRHRAVKLIPRTLDLDSCAKWVSITTKEDLILEKFRAEALPLPNQPRWRPAHWASKCIMGESGGVVRKWALAGVRTGNIFARLTSLLP